MIEAAELRDRLAGLEPIGLHDGATTRLAWTEELAAAEAWFGEQARDAGLTVERDPAGSLWAVPAADGRWWATGSHVDSVRSGGRYDGALGVAAGFAVASRAPEWLGRLRGFAELHIDQTQDLERLGEPAGAVSAMAARMRLAVTLTGRADHAGTTRRDERADALHAAARLILAADELAGADRDFLVTATRILAEPNAFTTVPGRVRLWIDARTPDGARLAAWRDELAAHAETLGVECAIAVASRSPALRFDDTVRDALGPLPQLVSFAGHDAGILGEKLPAGMVFVRNPTGISHAPEEAVALEDAAVAATALQRALEALT